MHDLAVLVPARNERFLARTIEDILKFAEGDTEVIAVLDGKWADPPVPDHPRVHVIYHVQAVGQRAAVNEAARMANSRYVMKLDAHCALGAGFDVKLVEPYLRGELMSEVASVPRMYNLHAFDWVCACGERTYQGPHPQQCVKCGSVAHEMDVLWRAKKSPTTTAMLFDSELHFQYFGAYKKRPEAQGELSETMSLLGACWVIQRDRFFALGGMDTAHGSWGQVGTEVACKSWLSGGRLVCNQRTWFAHMFRTQPGFRFPYPNAGPEQARAYSRQLWLNNAWPGQVHPLAWLVEKFRPVPGWHDEKGVSVLEQVNEAGRVFAERVVA